MEQSCFFALLVFAWTSTVETKFHAVDLSNLAADSDPEVTPLDKENLLESWTSKVYSPKALAVLLADVETNWDYNVNITDENQDATVLSSAQTANFTRILAEQARKLNNSISDANSKRLYKKLSELGSAALPDKELKELTELVNEMTKIYSTATVCFDEKLKDACPPKFQWPLDPNITNFFMESFDAVKLRYLWKGWRDATGAKMRKMYIRYVELKNKVAQLNGYKDAGEYWRSNYAEPTSNYTDEDVLKDLDDLWTQIKPLYDELHAYVRRKLIEKYPNEFIKADGPIPGHLLGNMWAQSWKSLLNFTQLFPHKALLDVTEEMKRQNYTVDQMFHLSQQFQLGLGLKPMPPTFWNESMFEKPANRDVVCHASAWDFYQDNDVRIKMCTQVNMEDLITIHHEMGHIQYYLQYADQMVPFRDGANSGFHEAVGDTLALSVSTPKHLAWLGLLHNNTEDKESDLNYMFATALEKIVFLPFGYLVDRYRYDVFSGKINSSQLNKGWWDYVLKYQGVSAPIRRTENDFDPGSKFHVATDTEYMRYFISFVIQFQFHKALCNASGHTGPLYQCDINESKAAGKLFSDMLSLGSSEPWPVALEKITGSRKMNANALLEFFEPLTQYIHKINVKNGDFAGWTTQSLFN